MRIIWGIITAFITLSLFCVDVYAVQTRNSDTNASDSVIGQVSITNVDSADNSKKLNGAHIKIVDKNTNKEYTDIIKDDGILVYELPLGSYLLTQVLAPNDYQLNSRVFEFTLQLPEGADVSNIKVVNASVLLTNDSITADTEHVPAEVSDSAAPPSARPASSVTLAPVSESLNQGNNTTPDNGKVSSANKNPVTADTSIILLAIIIFLVIIISGGLVFRKHLNSKF